jgi:hypothetical protein|nr:MAG TPA: Endonuclease [Caudoviricetes sp.]
MSKYHNRKVAYKGLVFDSIKERNYYMYLESLLQAGEITDLELQVKFEIQPRFKAVNGHIIRPITYLADFVYKDKDGKTVIVDVKGYKTDVYKLKKKLMLYKGYDIVEV